MRWYDSAWLLALAVTCAQANDAYRRVSIDFDLPERVSPASFSVCAAHGCNQRVPVSLSQEQWKALSALFEPPAATAADERRQVAAAIANMELLVAGFADTHHDKGGDFNGILEPGTQLDCVDESVNTTTYLTLFEQQGLLRHHRVLPRLSRGYLFFGGWPHFTAAIETRDAQAQQWVVDSWFRDNGQPPDILDADTWLDGWSPPGFSM